MPHIIHVVSLFVPLHNRIERLLSTNKSDKIFQTNFSNWLDDTFPTLPIKKKMKLPTNIPTNNYSK